jgi:hypothetical protein
LLLDPPLQVLRFTIARGNIPRPDALPPHSLLLKTIADADIEDFSLNSLKAHIEANEKAVVINRPDRVTDTARDRNAVRLNSIGGLTFLRTEWVRFKNANIDKVAKIASELEFDYSLSDPPREKANRTKLCPHQES